MFIGTPPFHALPSLPGVLLKSEWKTLFCMPAKPASLEPQLKCSLHALSAETNPREITSREEFLSSQKILLWKIFETNLHFYIFVGRSCNFLSCPPSIFPLVPVNVLDFFLRILTTIPSFA
jgi:hypothetical protein